MSWRASRVVSLVVRDQLAVPMAGILWWNICVVKTADTKNVTVATIDLWKLYVTDALGLCLKIERSHLTDRIEKRDMPHIICLFMNDDTQISWTISCQEI